MCPMCTACAGPIGMLPDGAGRVIADVPRSRHEEPDYAGRIGMGLEQWLRTEGPVSQQ